MDEFPKRAQELARLAGEVASRQGARLEAELLAHGRPELVWETHDNWDGGLDYYNLILSLPLDLYATAEAHQDDLEKAIQERVNRLLRTEPQYAIGSVIITPSMDVRRQEAFGEELRESVAPTFWPIDRFRLFISHPSSAKEEAHALRNALRPFAVVGFVAHDDIEPTREWQHEIETALRTMDASVALVTTDFVTSRWCDQEVGWAYGRGRLVIALKLDADPHGFMGKSQALAVQGVGAPDVAQRVFELLIQHEKTRERMVDILVTRLEQSGSWDSSKRTTNLIESAPYIPEHLLERLEAAPKLNHEVSDAWWVPGRIARVVKKHRRSQAMPRSSK